ncbi:MAG: YCF48-related protein [bacterium]|nr:YCF48-related protein [bacterium]
MKTIFILIFLYSYTSNCSSQQGWLQQNSGSLRDLKSVSFINLETGFCVGNSGTILRTTNGGKNWIDNPIGLTKNLNAISFTPNKTGFIVGDSGCILKTTDIGNSWIALNVDAMSITTIYVINDTIIYCNEADGIPNKFLKTTNAGINWIVGTPVGTVTSMSFINANTGWAAVVWTGDELFKTTDGALTWERQFVSAFGSNIRSVFY